MWTAGTASCTKVMSKLPGYDFAFLPLRLGQWGFFHGCETIKHVIFYDIGATHPHNPHPVLVEALVCNFGCVLRIPSAKTRLLIRR